MSEDLLAERERVLPRLAVLAALSINAVLLRSAEPAALQLADTFKTTEKEGLRLNSKEREKLDSKEKTEEEIAQIEQRRKDLLKEAIEQIRRQVEVRVSLLNLLGEEESEDDQRLAKSLKIEEKEKKPGEKAIEFFEKWHDQAKAGTEEFISDKLKDLEAAKAAVTKLMEDIKGKEIEEISEISREGTKLFNTLEEKSTRFFEGISAVRPFGLLLDRISGGLKAQQKTRIKA